MGKMHDRQDSTIKLEELRQQAEKRIEKQSHPKTDMPADLLDLINELNIHQAELEIQNEELKRTQTVLSKLHKEYHDLYYDSAPCGHITINPLGLITRINRTGVFLLGLENKRVTHMPFRKFVDPEYEDIYLQAVKQNHQDRQVVELKVRRERGLPLWVQVEIAVDKDKTGAVTQRRMILFDITSRKNAEEAFQLSEMKFRLVTESIEEVFWMSTCGVNEMIYISPAYETIWGKTRKSLYKSPKSFVESIHPDDVDDYLEFLDQYHLNGLPYTCEYRIIRNNGQIIWIQERAYPVSQSFNGKLLMTGVCTDITKSRKAKTDLEEMNTVLRVLLDKREKEKNELGENVLRNVENLILPYLKKIREAGINQNSITFLKILESNLKELLLPFGSKLQSLYHSLTPTEIRIADLIRNGKTTKEIANLLGVSNNAVMVHRHHIRKKLNLLRKKINMQTYLKSIR